MYSFTQKRLCQWIARKCSIKEDFNQNDNLSIIEHENIKQYHFFAGFPRSCIYLLLKTLFYFISQCTSVPYLESGLCKFGKELDNCNFTFI